MRHPATKRLTVKPMTAVPTDRSCRRHWLMRYLSAERAASVIYKVRGRQPRLSYFLWVADLFELVVALTGAAMVGPITLGYTPVRSHLALVPDAIELYMALAITTGTGVLMLGWVTSWCALRVAGLRFLGLLFIAEGILLVFVGEYPPAGTLWFAWYVVVGLLAQLQAWRLGGPQRLAMRLERRHLGLQGFTGDTRQEGG